MSQTKDIRIKSKVDSKVNWESFNTVLLDREVGYERETGKYKIGDDIRGWNELPYADFGVGSITPEGGEAFNSTTVAGLNSHAEGNDTKVYSPNAHGEGMNNVILEGVKTSNQIITFVNYTSSSKNLKLSTDNDFFTNSDLYGFHITNTYDKKAQVDVLKTTSKTQNSDGSWTFTLEEAPHSMMHLEAPNNIKIIVLLNDDETGEYSHVEGWSNVAMGRASHVEGWDNKVIENYGHAEGAHNTAGYLAHAEGTQTNATGKYSHTEGANTTAKGVYSHAEGYQTTASASSAHAEGNGTTASGPAAHAEGNGTTAKGQYSHAEGFNTTAEGQYAHAEGYSSTASGNYSHAEGVDTEAGAGAHSEGIYTKALGDYSHAEGVGTQTNTSHQHVQGRYNEIDEEGKYAHIIGNGLSSAKRKNIHTVDWDGNAMFAGDITVGVGNNKAQLQTRPIVTEAKLEWPNWIYDETRDVYIYDMNEAWPHELWDLSISLNTDILTREEKDAFDDAECLGGSLTTNSIVAYGSVPPTDIPIIIQAVRKTVW